jgi:hypothetical protein
MESDQVSASIFLCITGMLEVVSMKSRVLGWLTMEVRLASES